MKKFQPELLTSYEEIKSQATMSHGRFCVDGEQYGLCTPESSSIFQIIHPKVYLKRSILYVMSAVGSDVLTSSPSMVVHLIASLALGFSLGNFILEEIRFGYKADFVFQDIVFDITGDSLGKKLSKLNSALRGKCEFCAVNKWSVVGTYLTDCGLGWLEKGARLSDSGDTNYILERTRSNLNHFMLDPKISYRPSIASFLAEDDEELDDRCLSELVRRARKNVSRMKEQNPEENLPATLKLITDWRDKLTFVRNPFFSVGATSCDEFYRDPLPIDVSPCLPHANNPLITAGEAAEEHELNDIKSEYFSRTNEPLLIPEELIDDVISDAQLERFYSFMRHVMNPFNKAKLYELRSIDGHSDKTVLDDGSIEYSPRRWKVPEGTAVMNPKPLFGEFNPTHLKTDISAGMDPEHKLIIQSNVRPRSLADNLIEYFTQSRDYMESLIKRRLAKALRYSKKGAVYEMNTNLRIDDEPIIIRYMAIGLHMKSDSGMCLVSYMHRGCVIRFEKIRPVDIPLMEVAAERMVSVCSGLSITIQKIESKLMDIYCRLISERSWGISRVLKPYRYLVTGLCMKSTQILSQAKKFISSFAEGDEFVPWAKKPSLYLLLHSIDGLTIGRSPVGNLSFGQIGYEAFLMNLCPSETYGKRRHRVNVLLELFDEIDLSELHEELVSSLSDHFESVIMNNPTNDQISDHFDMIEAVADATDSRFTFSPISILLIRKHLRSLIHKTKGASFTGVKTSELLTMRGSYNSLDISVSKAYQSILALLNEKNMTSSSIAAMSLVFDDDPIDLSLRMFDKDQIGGDREISVMSESFRVLQSMTESVSRTLGKASGIDMLANKQKLKLITDKVVKANRRSNRLFFTGDHTRWGPNFNTVLFSYMYCSVIKLSTEMYIPALFCCLAENKLFEAIAYPELQEHMRDGYSIRGRIGRFHMGQGIFHYTSSLYHSMVTLVLGDVFERIVRPVSTLVLDYRPFVTSDDLLIITTLERANPGRDWDEKEQICGGRFNSLYGILENCTVAFFRYFGIKSSDYKNHCSSRECEFNSIFFGQDAVGSNSLKFLYSLVDPKTTGDLLLDFSRPCTVYSDCVNSGLSDIESKIVSDIMYFRARLQWGIQPNQACRFTKERLLLGLRPSIEDPMKTLIRHRPVFKKLTYKEASSAFEKFSEGLIISHEKGRLRSTAEGLENAQAIQGPLRSTFVSEKLKNKYHISLTVPNYDHPVPSQLPSPLLLVTYMCKHGSEYVWEENMPGGMGHKVAHDGHMARRRAPRGMCVINYRKTDRDEFSTMDLFVSSYPLIEYINKYSSFNDLSLHTLRKHKKANFTFPEDFELLPDPTERYLQLDTMVKDATSRRGGVSRLEFLEQEKMITVCYSPSITLGIPSEKLFHLKRSDDIGPKYARYEWRKDRQTKVNGEDVPVMDEQMVSLSEKDIVDVIQRMEPPDKCYSMIEAGARLSAIDDEDVINITRPVFSTIREGGYEEIDDISDSILRKEEVIVKACCESPKYSWLTSEKIAREILIMTALTILLVSSCAWTTTMGVVDSLEVSLTKVMEYKQHSFSSYNDIQQFISLITLRVMRSVKTCSTASEYLDMTSSLDKVIKILGRGHRILKYCGTIKDPQYHEITPDKMSRICDFDPKHPSNSESLSRYRKSIFKAMKTRVMTDYETRLAIQREEVENILTEMTETEREGLVSVLEVLQGNDEITHDERKSIEEAFSGFDIDLLDFASDYEEDY